MCAPGWQVCCGVQITPAHGFQLLFCLPYLSGVSARAQHVWLLQGPVLLTYPQREAAEASRNVGTAYGCLSCMMLTAAALLALGCVVGLALLPGSSMVCDCFYPLF